LGLGSGDLGDLGDDVRRGEGSELAARCIGVTRRFRTPTGDVLALDAVDLDVERGAFTVVSGPSGSGKSTLLALVACLDRPDSGRVELESVDVGGLSRRDRRKVRRQFVGVVLPQPSDNLLDRLDAAGNVRWSRRLRPHAPAGNEGIEDAFAALGLADAMHKRVRELSGGEQQRVALACALAGRPALVVCDEPTASLDRTNSVHVVQALRAASNGGQTVLVATHDPDVISAADVVVHLDHGVRR
jgi:ABC-type lipoprotein export system ATPase subunit